MFTKKKVGTPLVTRLYLDHASATPMLPEAVEAMVPFLMENFGNASAVHTEGQRAKLALANARTAVARVLGIQPDLVTFTSGGTESNNLAIIGVIEAAYSRGVAYDDMEVVTTAIEHPATLETCEFLSRQGVKIKYVSVDSGGKILLTSLLEQLSDKTILVTVAYVNSEIGVIQDLGAISRILEKFSRSQPHPILFHADAAQAPLWLSCEMSRLGVDLLSLDGGKFGGGKGIGVLARRKRVVIKNIMFGGGQEGGVRPGTEVVGSIVGFATALQLVQASYLKTATQVSLIRDYFINQLKSEIPTVIINGVEGSDRVANNINISIPDIDSEFAVVTLDEAGIAISTKSACSSVGGGESKVVKAISNDVLRSTTTLRFTLGPQTSATDIDRTIVALKHHLDSIPKF